MYYMKEDFKTITEKASALLHRAIPASTWFAEQQLDVALDEAEQKLSQKISGKIIVTNVYTGAIKYSLVGSWESFKELYHAAIDAQEEANLFNFNTSMYFEHETDTEKKWHCIKPPSLDEPSPTLIKRLFDPV